MTDHTNLCPSCREPLDYPSGDGCAAMTKHKPVKGLANVTTQYSQMLQRLNDDAKDDWQECVSCGGPSKGDFCWFCINEE